MKKFILSVIVLSMFANEADACFICKIFRKHRVCTTQTCYQTPIPFYQTPVPSYQTPVAPIKTIPVAPTKIVPTKIVPVPTKKVKENIPAPAPPK